MRLIVDAFKIVLVIMYFLGCVAIIITSLVVADIWGHWWLCPIQIFVGLFLIVTLVMILDKRCGK